MSVGGGQNRFKTVHIGPRDSSLTANGDDRKS